MMMLRKTSLVLATTIVALAAVSAVDSASAQSRRIPDTSSLLARYRVTTDAAGDVAGYERVRRYNRSSAARVVRQGDLAAVVSDAPEDLRSRSWNRARPPAGAPLRASGGGRYAINEDATWSDGTPITSDDFIFTWRRGEQGMPRATSRGLNRGMGGWNRGTGGFGGDLSRGAMNPRGMGGRR
jgi:ABC-type transport system substrate-binding protein